MAAKMEIVVLSLALLSLGTNVNACQENTVL